MSNVSAKVAPHETHDRVEKLPEYKNLTGVKYEGDVKRTTDGRSEPVKEPKTEPVVAETPPSAPPGFHSSLLNAEFPNGKHVESFAYKGTPRQGKFSSHEIIHSNSFEGRTGRSVYHMEPGDIIHMQNGYAMPFSKAAMEDSSYNLVNPRNNKSLRFGRGNQDGTYGASDNVSYSLMPPKGYSLTHKQNDDRSVTFSLVPNSKKARETAGLATHQPYSLAHSNEQFRSSSLNVNQTRSSIIHTVIGYLKWPSGPRQKNRQKKALWLRM